jgi:hypothetical protein
MPIPGEHKTVQARILAYAQEIGWIYVPRGEAERRRGFDPDGVTPEAQARNASLFFGDLLHDRVRAFNPDYREAEGALLGEFRRLSADIAGNRDFLIYLRNQGKFFCAEQNRELDLTLIDYGDLARPREAWQNVYEVVRNAYARRVYVDRAFQKKTNELVQRHIGSAWHEERREYVTLDRSTIEIIKKNREGKATKVINLIKSIEKTAEENRDDPFLIAMAERARAVQESFEERQTDTEEALADLLAAIEKNERRKRDQAAKGLDALTYFVLLKLTDEGIPNPEAVSRNVREAFVRFPNWKGSDAELRELRKAVTFAIYAEEDNLEKVAAAVESFFTLLLGERRG